MSRAATASASLWDEVWAEYDARRAALARPAEIAQPRAEPEARPAQATPLPLEGSRAAASGAARWRWPLRLATLGLAAALLAYAASPLAAAVNVAAAVQRADTAALAGQADWERLRPGIEARLATLAGERLDGPPPGFVRQMQSDLAARLASPQGLGALLGANAPLGEAPAREWLQGAQPLEGGRWTVTLARPETPSRATTLTFELQDPLRLRWQVVDVTW
jgi:hypothetical protein